MFPTLMSTHVSAQTDASFANDYFWQNCPELALEVSKAADDPQPSPKVLLYINTLFRY